MTTKQRKPRTARKPGTAGQMQERSLKKAVESGYFLQAAPRLEVQNDAHVAEYFMANP